MNHLCTLVIYSNYVEDLWLRDAEMMSVALMSDVGAPKDLTSPLPVNGLPWAVARLGQSMLMVELIGRLQAVRRSREASAVCSHPQHKHHIVDAKVEHRSVVASVSWQVRGCAGGKTSGVD